MEKVVQRLFSTFANGWPGAGLLLQRILTAILLIRLGVIELTGTSSTFSMIPQLLGAGAGILLLVGLWTPVVGTFTAVIEPVGHDNPRQLPVDFDRPGCARCHRRNDRSGGMVSQCPPFRQNAHEDIETSPSSHPSIVVDFRPTFVDNTIQPFTVAPAGQLV